MYEAICVTEVAEEIRHNLCEEVRACLHDPVQAWHGERCVALVLSCTQSSILVYKQLKSTHDFKNACKGHMHLEQIQAELDKQTIQFLSLVITAEPMSHGRPGTHQQCLRRQQSPGRSK